MRLFLFSLLVTFSMNAQDNQLPYYEIPEAPESFTAGSVTSRMIDGLGFRYYWVTEGLSEKDLAFKPSESGQSSLEVVQHIHALSEMILQAAKEEVSDFTTEEKTYGFDEMRKLTLLNFQEASKLFKALETLENNKVIFKSSRGTREFPFWNLVNGPIADAIWHCGQVVSYRRSSGNPYNSKACLLYTSPSPRDKRQSRMPSSA